MPSSATALQVSSRPPRRPSRRAAALDRVSVRLGWFAFLCAPALLAVGHLGAGFDWRKTHISVYAARAPHDDWVTATMVLGALGILCLAVQVARGLRPLWWSGLLALLFCVAAGGLGALARYELYEASALHNKGLFVLVTAAPIGLFLSGLTVAVVRRRWAGVAVSLWASLGVAVYLLKPLLRALELGGFPGRGVSQRGAFLCLWCAAMLLLWGVSGSSNKRLGSEPVNGR